MSIVIEVGNREVVRLRTGTEKGEPGPDEIAPLHR